MRRAVLSILICMAGASPAFAFDCSKASRADEKAICAKPELTALDDRMAEIYQSAMARLDDAGKAELKKSQRVWIADRASCDGDGDCLKMRMESRIQELDPKPQSGPGGPQMLPWFRSQPGAKNRWQILVTGFTLVPQSLTVDSYLQQIEAELPTAEIPAEDIIPDGVPYQRTQSLTASYLSPRFLSATNSVYEFSGGAHGNYGSTFLNVNLESDQPVAFYDMFREGSESVLISECQRLLKQERAQRNNDDGESWDYRNVVVEKIGKLENWTFSADSAAVYFAPYEAGSFAEGEYECRIPLSFLQPMLKPGNPWSGG